MEIRAIRSLPDNKEEVLYTNKLPNFNNAYRYFTVPKDKCDEFITDLKKQHKELSRVGMLELFAGALIGGAAGYKLGFKNTFAQMLFTAVGAFMGAELSTKIFFDKQAVNAQKKLFTKYGVEEHTYLGKDGVYEVFDPKSPYAPKAK